MENLPRDKDELLYAARRHDGAAEEEAYLQALRERQRPWRELEEAVAELRAQVEKKWLLPLADFIVRVDRKLRTLLHR